MKFPYKQSGFGLPYGKNPMKEIKQILVTGKPIDLIPKEQFHGKVNFPTPKASPSFAELMKGYVTNQIHDEITVELSKKYPNLQDLMVHVQPMMDPNKIDIKINYTLRDKQWNSYYDSSQFEGRPKRQPRTCDCQMQVLMSNGCQCGGV